MCDDQQIDALYFECAQEARRQVGAGLLAGVHDHDTAVRQHHNDGLADSGAQKIYRQ